MWARGHLHLHLHLHRHHALIVTTTTTTTTVWVSSTPSPTGNTGFFPPRETFSPPASESESEQALKKYKDRRSKYDVEILIGLWKEKYERSLEGTPRQLARDAKKRLQ